MSTYYIGLSLRENRHGAATAKKRWIWLSSRINQRHALYELCLTNLIQSRDVTLDSPNYTMNSLAQNVGELIMRANS